MPRIPLSHWIANFLCLPFFFFFHFLMQRFPPKNRKKRLNYCFPSPWKPSPMERGRKYFPKHWGRLHKPRPYSVKEASKNLLAQWDFQTVNHVSCMNERIFTPECLKSKRYGKSKKTHKKQRIESFIPVWWCLHLLQLWIGHPMQISWPWPPTKILGTFQRKSKTIKTIDHFHYHRTTNTKYQHRVTNSHHIRRTSLSFLNFISIMLHSLDNSKITKSKTN